MKNNSTTLSFCTANCCSWFYHLPVWYKFLCNFQREFVCRALQSMMHCSKRSKGTGSGHCHSIWVTADTNWRTWLLPGAARGWAGWWQYAKSSPHGITERKRRTASYSWSVLLSYKLRCMWAFSSPLITVLGWYGYATWWQQFEPIVIFASATNYGSVLLQDQLNSTTSKGPLRYCGLEEQYQWSVPFYYQCLSTRVKSKVETTRKTCFQIILQYWKKNSSSTSNNYFIGLFKKLIGLFTRFIWLET